MQSNVCICEQRCLSKHETVCFFIFFFCFCFPAVINCRSVQPSARSPENPYTIFIAFRFWIQWPLKKSAERWNRKNWTVYCGCNCVLTACTVFFLLKMIQQPAFKRFSTFLSIDYHVNCFRSKNVYLQCTMAA